MAERGGRTLNGAELSPIVQLLLLYLAGAIAGTVNVLAGGGSTLTLPLMIFLGLPPTVANGTNRVAILVQNVGAVSGFRRHGLMDGRWLGFAIPPALVGAALGTWMAMVVGDLALQRVLGVVMVGVAVWMIWNPIQPPDATEELAGPPTEDGRRWAFRIAFLALGVYGGFLQAGLGFMILAVCATAGIDIIRSNALKVAIVLAFTPIALVGFAWAGLVDWGLGAVLAAGNLTGAMLGVRLTVLKGQAWVRRVVTAMVILFAVRLLITG